ncbi:hypothetical protein RIF29_07556 [Crotalaria pallida]|uniref:Uncharacterized protein n=1 Tax=Crotalaria pallida TaxID=3830 RepID=A0AAN9J5F7_CROPI
MALIKLLHKIGKKAQLQSFDKAPLKSKDGSQLKQNQTPHCCCKSEKQIEHCCCGSSSSSSDSKDDSTRHKTRHGRRSKKNQGCNEGYGTYGNRNVAAVGTGYNNYHPPMPGYHQPFTGHHYPPRPKYYQPFTGYNYHPAMPGNQSMAYAAAPPPPPPYAARGIPLYGYYGRGQPLPPYTYR